MKKIISFMIWVLLVALIQLPLPYLFPGIRVMDIVIIDLYMYLSIVCLNITSGIIKTLIRKKQIKQINDYLKYSFINNSILLTTDTINKNGFYEVWRQENKEHSIQILCFNQETNEFQAFDRFHWMDEPYYDGPGCISDGMGWCYQKNLWTPIKLHYTLEWLKKHVT